jgi:hypothetical protein
MIFYGLADHGIEEVIDFYSTREQPLSRRVVRQAEREETLRSYRALRGGFAQQARARSLA